MSSSQSYVVENSKNIFIVFYIIIGYFVLFKILIKRKLAHYNSTVMNEQMEVLKVVLFQLLVKYIWKLAIDVIPKGLYYRYQISYDIRVEIENIISFFLLNFEKFFN